MLKDIEIKNDNIINAANYEKICDYSIIPPENKSFDDKILSKNCSIFCKTDFLGYLFENIKKSDKKHILLTHHSDYPITKEIFLNRPKCIKKWYAINPTHKDDNLIAIPLGIKTHRGIYYEEKYKSNWFMNSLKSLRKTKKENKIYCNWSNTNPIRNEIIKKLENNQIPFTLESNLSFENYVLNMSKHKFVLSPPGNGIDCHRTWESLYLGCIPIVIKDYIYDNWKDLPILQVDDYSNIKINELFDFLNKKFSYEKITIKYWQSLIKNDLKIFKEE